jgi:hypothetical protein
MAAPELRFRLQQRLPVGRSLDKLIEKKLDKKNRRATRAAIKRIYAADPDCAARGREIAKADQAERKAKKSKPQKKSN